MGKTDYYAMTDAAIARSLGERLEQLRLEANIPQKELAAELGISEGTYRSAIKGKARLAVIIGLMRALGKLDQLDQFLPSTPFSPMERLKLEGKKRQRARPPKRSDSDDSDNERELSW